jgi:DNA-binding XRE family transcriptional regulator
MCKLTTLFYCLIWPQKTGGIRQRLIRTERSGPQCSDEWEGVAQMLYYPYMPSKDPDKEIGNKLKKARLGLGLRQVDLAKKAKINSNYYAKVERGEAIPTLTTLKKILKALGMKSSEILPF